MSSQDTTQATKHCTTCHTEVETAFYKQHKHICRECLNAQNKARWEAQHQEWEERRAKWEREHGETWEVSRAREAKEQAEREERRKREQQEERLRAEWYAAQPDRKCIACGVEKKATEYGCSLLVPSPDNVGMWMPERLHTRCKPCREAYREKNRQVNPLCPMCNEPARTQGGFLREYQGHRLDIIKVCCTGCIPQFEALPEGEQIALLRRAMVKTYGETAVIYALHYDESGAVHHIGRTKRLTRRMAEYRRRWDKEIASYSVLEEIPFGPLSMERESRWILHALKAGWPIDNYDMHTIERRTSRRELWRDAGSEYERPIDDSELGQRERETKERLIQEVARIEPLTCPFEVIAPIIHSGFMNVCDMDIVHWLVSRPEIC